MSRIPVVIFIAFIVSGMFAACRKNVSCFNAKNYDLQFYTTSLADTITDTGASIVKYGPGSNFLALVDSVPGIIVLSNFSAYYVGRFAQQYIPYTIYSSDIYSTDLLITLYPSGRVYRMKNIAHDNRTMSEKNTDNYSCTDNITYEVNDSPYVCAAQTFNQGVATKAIMNIRY